MSLMLFPDPQQLGQVLSPDPRGSLFSSAVPATPPMRSWIHQVALEAGVSKQENLNYPASISSVAMMSEAGLDDRLILLGDRGERTELPMAYLAHLWPTALKFPLPITFTRQLTLFTTGPAGLVVLIGVRM